MYIVQPVGSTRHLACNYVIMTKNYVFFLYVLALLYVPTFMHIGNIRHQNLCFMSVRK